MSVYSYDRALQPPYLVTDIQYYWLNLTRANERLSADWEGVRLQATRDYGLSDLSPAHWWKLTETLLAGGAADVYDAMQSVWYKGMDGAEPSSVNERQCFACSLETDTHSQLAECSARAQAKCGQPQQRMKQQQPDKCGSYTADQVEAMRQRAAALEQLKAALDQPTTTPAADEKRRLMPEHRHARRGAATSV